MRWNSAVAAPIVAPNLGMSVCMPFHTAESFRVVNAMRTSLIAPLLRLFRINASMALLRHLSIDLSSQHALIVILSSSWEKALFLTLCAIRLRLLEKPSILVFLGASKSSYGLVECVVLCSSIKVISKYIDKFYSSSILIETFNLLRDVNKS